MFEQQENWPNGNQATNTRNRGRRRRILVPENNTSNLGIFPRLAYRNALSVLYFKYITSLSLFDCAQANQCSSISMLLFLNLCESFFIFRYALKQLYSPLFLSSPIPLPPPFIWTGNVFSNRYSVKPIVMEMKLFKLLKYCVCIRAWVCCAVFVFTCYVPNVIYIAEKRDK